MIAGLVCAGVSALLFIYGYTLDYGYRRGFKDGHAQGRAEGHLEGKAAETNWWIGVEDEVDRKRQEIWRADGQREEERWP